MSGGSFNYLCFADPEDLPGRVEDLNRMREALVTEGALDAAQETEDILLIMRQTFVRLHARTERLKDVWRAMEWWRSGDYGPAQFAEAIAEYRNDEETTKPVSPNSPMEGENQ